MVVVVADRRLERLGWLKREEKRNVGGESHNENREKLIEDNVVSD